jgi:hypothetical protein
VPLSADDWTQVTQMIAQVVPPAAQGAAGSYLRESAWPEMVKRQDARSAAMLQAFADALCEEVLPKLVTLLDQRCIDLTVAVLEKVAPEVSSMVAREAAEDTASSWADAVLDLARGAVRDAMAPKRTTVERDPRTREIVSTTTSVDLGDGLGPVVSKTTPERDGRGSIKVTSTQSHE